MKHNKLFSVDVDLTLVLSHWHKSKFQSFWDVINIFCPSIQCSIRKEDNENACIFVFICRLNCFAFFMHFSCNFHTFQTLVKVTRLISSDAYRILCNICDIFFHILSYMLRRFLNMPQVLFSALLRFDVSKILWKSTHFRVILSLIFL